MSCMAHNVFMQGAFTKFQDCFFFLSRDAHAYSFHRQDKTSSHRDAESLCFVNKSSEKHKKCASPARYEFLRIMSLSTRNRPRTRTVQRMSHALHPKFWSSVETIETPPSSRSQVVISFGPLIPGSPRRPSGNVRLQKRQPGPCTLEI